MLLALCLALVPLHAQISVCGQEPFKGWLLDHQDADGRWDADGFEKHDPAGSTSGDAGAAEYDVLATSVALWAMLGDGHSSTEGAFKRDFTRGLRWLLAQQNFETGFISETEHELDFEHHAIATVVIADVQYYAPGPIVEDACLRALDALLTRQHADGGFGRAAESESSATAWSAFALVSASMAGIEVEDERIGKALTWLQERTNDQGLVLVGEDGVDDTATALAVLCSLIGQPSEAERAGLAAICEVLVERLVDDEEADAARWFVVAAACYQCGGAEWNLVNGHVKREIVDAQRKDDGPAKLSWDAPGAPGGRVVQSAWNTLSLELFFRYARVLPGRQ